MYTEQRDRQDKDKKDGGTEWDGQSGMERQERERQVVDSWRRARYGREREGGERWRK